MGAHTSGRAPIAALVVVAAFAAGHWTGVASTAGPSAPLDDYAVDNVLHELAYANHLRHGRHEVLAELLAIRLDDHIERLRATGGEWGADEPMAQARLRALADVADWWTAHPPALPSTVREQGWVADWDATHRENVAFVDAARAACDRLGCRPPGSSLAWLAPSLVPAGAAPLR